MGMGGNGNRNSRSRTPLLWTTAGPRPVGNCLIPCSTVYGLAISLSLTHTYNSCASVSSTEFLEPSVKPEQLARILRRLWEQTSYVARPSDRIKLRRTPSGLNLPDTFTYLLAAVRRRRLVWHWLEQQQLAITYDDSIGRGSIRAETSMCCTIFSVWTLVPSLNYRVLARGVHR